MTLVPGEPGADRHWLTVAIELSRRCPPSDTAFSVGAILVSVSGTVLATGYSRETDPKDHAEEAALAKAHGATQPSGLADATLYTSLEPCAARASRPATCAQLIAAAGLRRVVFAWREPPVFEPGGGAEWLARRGIAITEIADLADTARAVNAHLFSQP